MPIYEFKCADCGEVSELLSGIGRNSDDTKCPICGGHRLEKLMSAASIGVRSSPENQPVGSTCCGSDPSKQGCIPGSCCGAE